LTTIYKYPLSPGNPITVEMPKYARILAVGAQGDGPVIWALVDPTPEETRTFYVYGTGHNAYEAPDLTYIGTCQTDSGLVWHVFEKPVERNVGEMLMEMVGDNDGR
jgi:hypothetical protein